MDVNTQSQVEKWQGALLLLRNAALSEVELIEFFRAVKMMCKLDGYELCRDYELTRLEQDYNNLKNMVHSAYHSANSVTTHMPRV